MTPAQLADAVGENIEGGRLAGHFLARLPAETLDPDELLRALLLAQAASPDRLRGFCRRIQKQLERGRPMRPTEGRGLGRDGSPSRAADDKTRAAIIPPLGCCINCGQHIRLTAGVTTCPTCSAWAKWYRLHLAASRALQEIQR